MEVPNDQAAPDAQLHLIESVRAKAQEICTAEGATLNEFVNVAVAEKTRALRSCGMAETP